MVSPSDLKYGSCGLGSTARRVGCHGSAINYSHQYGRLILNKCMLSYVKHLCMYIYGW
jgi:hypothetical protein